MNAPHVIAAVYSEMAALFASQKKESQVGKCSFESKSCIFSWIGLHGFCTKDDEQIQ